MYAFERCLFVSAMVSSLKAADTGLLPMLNNRDVPYYSLW